MVAGWAAEGVGTGRVVRLPGKLPGIYLIQTDESGRAPVLSLARNCGGAQLMDLPETDAHAGFAGELRSRLSLGDHAVALQREGRARLIAALRRARERGRAHGLRHQFSRPRLARSRYRARRLSRAFAAADIVLASTEDLLPLYPGESDDSLMARISSPEAVLKLLEPASIVRFEGVSQRGEGRARHRAGRRHHGGRRQFFGGLSSPPGLRARSRSKRRAPGHRLAGVVVCYPGAIIPRSAMPANIIAAAGNLS